LNMASNRARRVEPRWIEPCMKVAAREVRQVSGEVKQLGAVARQRRFGIATSGKIMLIVCGRGFMRREGAAWQ